MDFAIPRDAHLFRAAGPPRRTERVTLSVPIQVTGTDASGRQFSETTHTRALSGYGARIVLNRALQPGQEIAIYRFDKSRHAGARVVHELAGSDKGRVYGVAFIDPAADLWGACQLLTEASQEAPPQPPPASTPDTDIPKA